MTFLGIEAGRVFTQNHEAAARELLEQGMVTRFVKLPHEVQGRGDFQWNAMNLYDPKHGGGVFVHFENDQIVVPVEGLGQ